jgi:glutamyl-tRNA reductase
VLDQLGVIGVSWRQANSDGLAEFALPAETERERLRAFAARSGVEELAYLATCNRVELIFARPAGDARGDMRPLVFEFLAGRAPTPGEAERRLRAWGGEGAAEHLFLVAAGLDSACLGEAEVVGQVRRCWDTSRQLGLCGMNLETVFDEALRLAAAVRGETRLGQGRVSLAEIAVQALRERIAEQPGTVALIGVSPMTERVARALADQGIPLLFVNRSRDKAAALARTLGGDALSLGDFCAAPPPLAALASATGAGVPVLPRATLERLAAASAPGLLIVDMAVPGDVAPDVCAELGLRRLGMDEINRRAESNRASRQLEAAEARERVDAALAHLQEAFAERLYGPLFAALQQRYQRTAVEGVRRLLKKELKGIGPEQEAAIQAWAGVLARRFAHVPCLGLRGLLHHGPEGSLDAFLSELEPEFADELRHALMPRQEPRAPQP